MMQHKRQLKTGNGERNVICLLCINSQSFIRSGLSNLYMALQDFLYWLRYSTGKMYGGAWFNLLDIHWIMKSGHCIPEWYWKIRVLGDVRQHNKVILKWCTVEYNKTGNMYLESKYGQFWCERSFIAFLLNREIYSFEGKSINNNKVGNFF